MTKRSMIMLKGESLLNCPCCGSRAEYYMWNSKYVYDKPPKECKVACTKCSLRTCFVSSKAQAKKSWNRRPDSIGENK